MKVFGLLALWAGLLASREVAPLAYVGEPFAALKVIPISTNKLILYCSSSGRAHLLSDSTRRMDAVRLAPLSSLFFDKAVYAVSSNEIRRYNATNLASEFVFKAPSAMEKFGYTSGKLLVRDTQTKRSIGLFDLASGKILWTHQVQDAKLLGLSSNSCSIIFPEKPLDTVHFGAAIGTVMLEALDLETGKSLWRTPFGADQCYYAPSGVQWENILWSSCEDIVCLRSMANGYLIKSYKIPGEMVGAQEIIVGGKVYAFANITTGGLLKTGFQGTNRLFEVSTNGLRHVRDFGGLGRLGFSSVAEVGGSWIVLSGGVKFQCVDVRTGQILYEADGRYKAAFASTVFSIAESSGVYVISGYDLNSRTAYEFGRFHYKDLF